MRIGTSGIRRSRLDGEAGVAPAGDDHAARLVARATEAAADVREVGEPGGVQELARALRASARLAADEELRRARHERLDGGDEVGVGPRLTAGAVEEDRHVARARGVSGLELRRRAYVEVHCVQVLAQDVERLRR